MIQNKSVSLSDQVFDRIEEDILTGKYARGSYLTELGLCAELGVSRTPVREALARLAQEHLVEPTGKGMLVLSITAEDAEVIYTIRSHVDGLAAAACAANISAEQVKELRGIVEMQEYFAARNDSEKVKELDTQFHELIYRFSGSIALYDTLIPLHKKVLKYRRLSVENATRSGSSSGEHRAIFEAIASHNPELAEKCMKEHIENANAFIQEKENR